MKFTKQQVLDAIDYEYLAPGHWETSPRQQERGGFCGRCAVGSLLRSVNIEPTSADVLLSGGVAAGVAEYGQDVYENRLLALISEGSYLEALSGKFENLCGEFGYHEGHVVGEDIRTALKEWVIKNYPPEFETTELGTIDN